MTDASLRLLGSARHTAVDVPEAVLASDLMGPDRPNIEMLPVGVRGKGRDADAREADALGSPQLHTAAHGGEQEAFSLHEKGPERHYRDSVGGNLPAGILCDSAETLLTHAVGDVQMIVAAAHGADVDDLSIALWSTLRPAARTLASSAERTPPSIISSRLESGGCQKGSVGSRSSGSRKALLTRSSSRPCSPRICSKRRSTAASSR